MSTLNDTDLFVVERSGTNYKIEAKDISTGPTGSIEQPVTVLTPFNGAGLNDGETYQPLSTAITAVGAGGEVVYSTDTIASVSDTSYSIGVTANSSNNLERFLDVDLGTGYLDGSSNNSKYATFTGDPIRVKAGDVITIQGTHQNASHGLAIRLTDPNAQTIIAAIDNSTWSIGAWNDLAAYRWTAPYTIDSDYILTGFMVTNTGSDSGVGGLYINGEKLIANNDADTVLTFPTSNNFDKFEVGDVVQDGGWNQSREWSPLIQGNLNTDDGTTAEGLFNGVIGTNYTEGVTPVDGQSLLINFGESLNSVASVTISGYANNVSAGNNILKINGTSVSFSASSTSNQTYPLSNGLQTIEWSYDTAGVKATYI